MGDRSSARPLYSERADDPALSEALDAFALALADRIDQLQEVERAAARADSRESYAALVELTDLARRVRLGHRGAF